MYYGAIYEYGDSYKLEFPKRMDACYSYFLDRYQYKNDIRKYLHIYFNPYPDFTFGEVELLLNSLRKELSFTLRRFKPEETKKYSYGGKNVIFKEDEIYPVVTLKIDKLSLGEIKFIYFFIRFFHESDKHVKATRNAINAKKLLPNEKIINLLVFFSLGGENYSNGHHFVYGSSNSFKKFKSLKEFLNKHVTKDRFNNPSFKTMAHKSFDELIEIYKNI